MTNDILLFIAIGFLAQLVDGAIGMAYGITATTTLMSLGVTPATASASVHAAEVFTTAASGAAHWRLGNVDWRLVRRLAVPGMIGGAAGAYVLSTIPGDRIRPIVAAYLLVMGCVIIWRALRTESRPHTCPRHAGLTGFFGGFLDAIGGGGWGAMVTTTLIGRGASPRLAIGSANIARVLRHGDGDGYIRRHHRPVVVAGDHRPRRRRHPRRAIRGLCHQASARPPRHGRRWDRGDRVEPSDDRVSGLVTASHARRRGNAHCGCDLRNTSRSARAALDPRLIASS